MTDFALHPQLAADTLAIPYHGFSTLRLMNDRRFPWLIAVPQAADIEEIFQLSPRDQQRLVEEISRLSQALKTTTHCDKINIATFGNIVPQLHIHIIARFKEDPAWPGSAIGFAGAEPYAEGEADQFVERLKKQLKARITPSVTPSALF